MNQIPAVFMHTTAQLAAGIVVGTVVDGVFPEPCAPIRSGDWKSFMVLAVEVSGQLLVDGLFTWAMMDAISKLPFEMQDKTMGEVYALSLMHSQPKLQVKMNRLAGYTRNVFYRTIGTAPDDVTVKGVPSNKMTLPSAQKNVANAYM